MVRSSECGSEDGGSSPPHLIRLTLPLPPSLTNSGKGRSRHWRALEKEKVQYWDALDMLQMLKAIPARPLVPMETAEITVALYLWNLMDDGNAMARLKWAEDWMVKRGGFIRDDSRKHLKYTGIPDQQIDRDYQRAEILLRETTPIR